MFKSLLKFFGLLKNDNYDNQLDEQIEKSFDDFQNRSIYDKLTLEIIDSTPDDSLLQTVFDNLCQKFTKDKEEYETVLAFNKSQQAIYVIWVLEAEVNNGGFNQYYENSSGEYMSITPEALRLIGANKFADLMDKANKIYEDEHDFITKHMDGTLEGFSKSYDDNPLNDLDNEFYDYYTEENLMQLQVTFIRKNKNDFVG